MHGGCSSNTLGSVAIVAHAELDVSGKSGDEGKPHGSTRFRVRIASIDLNVSIVLKERYRFLIGDNSVNIFNHARFDLPVNNVPARNFGTIISLHY
jgi:hypothetical protein